MLDDHGPGPRSLGLCHRVHLVAPVVGHRWEQRLRRNEESHNKAAHHREPWGEHEVEFLTVLWDGTEETLIAIAEELGRTIEACRQRYYETQSGRKKPKPKAQAHQSGWLVGYCVKCGRHTDVYCDGTATMLCDDCR